MGSIRRIGGGKWRLILEAWPNLPAEFFLNLHGYALALALPATYRFFGKPDPRNED
jgi:hypothetical protein